MAVNQKHKLSDRKVGQVKVVVVLRTAERGARARVLDQVWVFSR